MENKNKFVGLGIGDVLFITFLVLKLVGVIDWSWWWVTAPLWIPLSIFIICSIALKIIELVDK